ncbi:hypothetical protein [Membranihabitans marinus]|uniref:hypothetical protein n=1 Tax=Membranihabitans marinus TaxID=1227546 RepID=UPI001F36CBDD|nr:hypothetical protein [Membranihabitans marinus]
MVNKLAGSYTVLKNEANRFVEDEYLDPKETVELVNMMIEFQKKSSDIVDILELDKEKNSNELQQISILISKLKSVLKTVLATSINGFK